MPRYYIYNLLFAGFVLPISLLIARGELRRSRLLLSARIALLVTVLYYPWDFFAIRNGAWTYPFDPGVRIYQVPFNDLVFIWLCSFLTCCVLVAQRATTAKGGK